MKNLLITTALVASFAATAQAAPAPHTMMMTGGTMALMDVMDPADRTFSETSYTSNDGWLYTYTTIQANGLPDDTIDTSVVFSNDPADTHTVEANGFYQLESSPYYVEVTSISPPAEVPVTFSVDSYDGEFFYGLKFEHADDPTLSSAPRLAPGALSLSDFATGLANGVDGHDTLRIDFQADSAQVLTELQAAVDAYEEAERDRQAQADRDAERNFADPVVHQDWTEVSRVVIEESRVEGEVVLGTAKTKYVSQTRVDTITAEAARITEERIMRVVVTDGDGDHVRNDDTTETRTRTEGGRVYQQTVNLGSVINPAYLAAKRALEKEIHDGFESGRELKGTFGPHDVEVTLNLDIGGIQAAKKFVKTESTVSHDLSAHVEPRVGLFGIGKGNYIGYQAGVEVGASVQKHDSRTKVTVGYDSGTHFHVQGSHNGFKGVGGNGQTDDAAFVETTVDLKDIFVNATTLNARVDSEGRKGVTIKDESGYSLGVQEGTDGHTKVTAGYSIKF